MLRILLLALALNPVLWLLLGPSIGLCLIAQVAEWCSILPRRNRHRRTYRHDGEGSR